MTWVVIAVFFRLSLSLSRFLAHVLISPDVCVSGLMYMANGTLSSRKKA